jgi:hypothetical protein
MANHETDRRRPVHLLVGHPGDPVCLAVRAALRERGEPATIVGNPVLEREFSWALDTASSSWSFELAGRTVRDDDVATILFRGAGAFDPIGWSDPDFEYIATESRAALTAWLWSVRRPVVNRLPVWLALRPRVPLADWQPHLRAAGLVSAPLIVSNVETRRPVFGPAPAAGGHGVLHAPLTGSAWFTAQSEDDWTRLARAQAHVPLVLSPMPGRPRAVWVVGREIVHEVPDCALESIEGRLVELGRQIRIDILRVTIDAAAPEPAVLAVDVVPDLALAPLERRPVVAAAIADLMTRLARDDSAEERFGDRSGQAVGT